MKQLFTCILVLILISFQGYSQSLVSTSVLPRNAVLEMFNGINCAYCDDGDLRAQQLANAFPGRVVRIIIHTGALADTLPGQPDFRTPFGPPLDSMVAVAAYPSGSMNRMVWPGTYSQPPYFPQNPPNNLAIRRQGWWDSSYPNTGTGGAIILNGGNTPVNIGAETIWDNITRELTVHVELYYTASDTVDNKLNVVFLENGIVGEQSTINGVDSFYVHNHMLRYMITGQWGDTVSTTSQGTLVSRFYTYTVPVGFNIDSSEIAVFVTQHENKHTHTAILVDAKNGSTVGINVQDELKNIGVYPNPAANEIHITGIPHNVKELSIINVLGKTVIQLNPNEEFITADIKKLPAGMYFILIKSQGGDTVRKFLKE